MQNYLLFNNEQLPTTIVLILVFFTFAEPVSESQSAVILLSCNSCNYFILRSMLAKLNDCLRNKLATPGGEEKARLDDDARGQSSRANRA